MQTPVYLPGQNLFDTSSLKSSRFFTRGIKSLLVLFILFAFVSLLTAQERPLFQAGPQAACAPANVQISNVFSGGDAYTWDFGNGQASFSPQPGSVTYQQPGVYTISLAVTASQGQRLLNRIEVLSIPGNWWEPVDNVPDLYALVKDEVGNFLFRSSVVRANPSNGPVSLPVAGLVRDQPYSVEIWDSDLFGNDDYLGTVQIDGGQELGTATDGVLSIAFGSVPSEEQYYYEQEIEVGVPTIVLDNGYLRVTFPPDGPGGIYRWYLDGILLPDLNTSAILPQGDGLYTVMVIAAAHNCIATSAPFEYDSLVGLEEVEDEAAVRLYPNPTASDLFISCDCSAGTRAELYNPLGSHILTQPLEALRGVARLKLGGLAPGIYALKLFDKEGQLLTVQQVVKY